MVHCGGGFMEFNYILKKLNELISYGVGFNTVLDWMEINDVNIYGCGYIGKIVCLDVFQFHKIRVFDRNVHSGKIWLEKYQEGEWVNRAYVVERPETMVESGTYTIVTPTSHYREIETYYVNRGMNRKYMLSVSLIMRYGELLLRNKRIINPLVEKNFLIVGGGTLNKGAQSMVFTVADKIKKKYRNAIVWVIESEFIDIGDKDYKKYDMLFLPDDRSLDSEIYEIVPHVDAIIDVSGYAITDNINVEAVDRCIFYWGVACDYKIPLYIMPQTIGNFHYTERKTSELRQLFSYARRAYAREEASQQLLTKALKLDDEKIKRGYDIVLSGEEVLKENIYISEEQLTDIEILQYAVAVIPNTQIGHYLGDIELDDFYAVIIDELIKLRKNIYIINHASDEWICRRLYKRYEKSRQVYLMEYNLDCLHFMSLIQSFQYVVASRYHATIHSFKKKIPCFVIGWDNKYSELMKIMGQHRHFIDIRNGFDRKHIAESIKEFNRKYDQEIETITDNIRRIQCQDVLSEVIQML